MKKEEGIEMFSKLRLIGQRGCYNSKLVDELCTMAIEALKQTMWIPVSEMLPEEDGEYLLFGKVTDADENCIFIGDYDACAEQFGVWQELFDRHTLGCLGSDFYEYESVIAWMPLPEKYKAES